MCFKLFFSVLFYVFVCCYNKMSSLHSLVLLRQNLQDGIEVTWWAWCSGLWEFVTVVLRVCDSEAVLQLRAFMLGDRNRLKPVWSRQQADRNNAVSVLHCGIAIAQGSPWRPFTAHYGRNQMLPLPPPQQRLTAGWMWMCYTARLRARFQEEMRAGGRGRMGICESAAESLPPYTHTHTHRQEHDLSFCCICLWCRDWLRRIISRSTRTQQMYGCNLTLNPRPCPG